MAEVRDKLKNVYKFSNSDYEVYVICYCSLIVMKNMVNPGIVINITSKKT